LGATEVYKDIFFAGYKEYSTTPNRNPFLAIDCPSDHFLLARSARARGACEFPFRSEPKMETGQFPFLAFPLSIPFFKLF
jgi:hypothetical protein